MSFAKVNKPLKPEDNFWELNPWLKIHPPYSELYKKHGAAESSKMMIAIFLMCDPDEEANPLSRMDEKMRKDVIASQYFDIGWDDTLVKKCLDKYPFDCMSSIERSFKEEKEKLVERARFIKEVQYRVDMPQPGEDFDKELFNAQLKAVALIESMQKNTEAMYKQYERIEEMFIQGKSTAVARGGRQLTRAEKREV